MILVTPPMKKPAWWQQMSSQPQTRSKLLSASPWLFVLFGFSILIIVWNWFSGNAIVKIIRMGPSSLVSDDQSVISDNRSVYNHTLGFQEIFALVLPNRQDRARPLIAGANATNLTINVLEAVPDVSLTREDIPPTYGTQGWEPKPGVLGCMASHHRIWKKMVDENIGSSLVLESDADWDMRIKSSMSGFSDGVKAVVKSMPTISAIQKNATHSRDFSVPLPGFASPYGEDWDILWIGHCGAQGHRYYAYFDPSAADTSHTNSYYEPPPEELFRSDGTRLVFQMSDRTEHSVVCTTGYAISNRGAHKLEKLFWTSDREVDVWLRALCSDEPGLVCLSSLPQIFSSAPAGPSNINDAENSGVNRTEELPVVGGKGIQISARVNGAIGLADKGPDAWKKEWAEEPLWAFDNGAVKERHEENA